MDGGHDPEPSAILNISWIFKIGIIVESQGRYVVVLSSLRKLDFAKLGS